MDNPKAYKRYLLKCGYSSDNIDSKFIRAAKVKRSKTLKPNKKVQKQNGKRKYYFNTSYDPEFPNIRACIKNIRGRSRIERAIPMQNEDSIKILKNI